MVMVMCKLLASNGVRLLRGVAEIYRLPRSELILLL